MSLNEGIARDAASEPLLATLRSRQRSHVTTAAFWLVGCAVVIAAQPGPDRRLAALGTAAAGLATIGLVNLLTSDPGRRYFRSLVGTMVVVAVAATWLIQSLTAVTDSFTITGQNVRITIPLMFVLFAPIVAQALPPHLRRPRELWQLARAPAELWRRAPAMDRIFGGYATVVLLPALLVGIAHGNRLTYIAQDLGLIVFFVFIYIAGRIVPADTARTLASEFVDLLLLLAVATYLLFGWTTPPLFEYMVAAYAGGLAFAFFRPRKTRLFPLGVALTIFVALLVSTKYGQRSETTIELLAALALLGYLAIRLKLFLPHWLVFAAAAVALAAFVTLTPDGAAFRGQYHGKDPSNLGRTYEAHQVRAEVSRSPVSLLFGRGLGGTVDESGASPVFATSLRTGGRNLAHVQEVHLLEYDILLKAGFVGILWLAAFTIGLAVLVLRALDKAAEDRDPSLFFYAALPLLSFAAAFAAATHLQDNPFNAFAIGILVTCLSRGRGPKQASPVES